MTPEEQKAMADRIAATRREEAKVHAKADKPAASTKGIKPKEEAVKTKTKTKVKVASKPKVSKRKPGPATAKFKFKPLPKSRTQCDVLNCKVRPSKGFRCTGHKKLIRKAQLKANNVVWKKRVKAGTAGHHVIYTRPGEKKPIATRWSLGKKTAELAHKKVAAGHSVVEKVGDFHEIVVRTRKERSAA